MRSLFIKSERYVCDESSAGEPPHLRLPSMIFTAGAYCRQQGLDVDILNVPAGGTYSFNSYDVVVSLVALLEGFHDGIKYLEEAKREGTITIMILNDPFEGLELEVMEKYSFIDYTIRLYERELVLGELLKELENKGSRTKPSFSGIIWRDDSRIIDNGKRLPLDSLEHLPSTAEILKKINLFRYEHVFLEAGRGCPNSCSFCFYRRTRPRKRRIEDLLSELAVVAGKVSHIWLHDLNMLANTKWTEQLCNEIIKSGIKAKWGTDIRMDQCIKYPDLLKKMNEAGCYLVALGVESADNRILKRIEKKAQEDYIDQAIKNCLAAGIKPSLNLMIGFPWDTNETLKKMEDTLYKCTYSFCDLQFVRPLRGTPLYQEYKDLGLLQVDLTVDDYIDSRKKPLFPTLSLNRKALVDWELRLKAITVLKILKRGEFGILAKVIKMFVNEKDFRNHVFSNFRKYISMALQTAKTGNK